MWAASTPVQNRKRKNPSSELDDLALSPIQKHGAKRRSLVLPRVPIGTTIEVVQAARHSRPLSDIGGISNLPPLSALPPRLSRLSTKAKLQKEDVCAPSREELIPPPSVTQRRTSSHASSAGLNSIISKAACNSKRNQSVYPELMVISDSEDESHLAETVHCRTRTSVAGKRRTSQVDKLTEPAPTKSDVPNVTEFVRQSSRVDKSNGARKSRYTLHLQAEGKLRLRAIREEKQSVLVERSEYVAFEATPVKEERVYDNTVSPSPKITKFSISDVESWKEVKDQPGCYFSRGLPALSAGVDGEPFPARCGYLKLSVKTKLDIPSSPNNIVFTVLKGKGHMKDKTNGAMEKTEMNISDTFVIPRGSAFTFINLATKNEFILGYVKHN